MNPLEGKTIVTTQPADQAPALIRLLVGKGARVLNLPMIETRTTPGCGGIFGPIFSDASPRLLIFTSKKGVRGWFENLHMHTGSYKLPAHVTIATVGEGTADTLKQFGHVATHINPGTNAADFAEFLLENVLQPGDEVILALGNKAPAFLENTLSEKARVTRINVYETLLLDQSGHPVARLIREKKADMCIFTSPSGFESFYGQFGELVHSIPVAAIGTTTAHAIRQARVEVVITAPEPSPESLALSIETFYKSRIKT